MIKGEYKLLKKRNLLFVVVLLSVLSIAVYFICSCRKQQSSTRYVYAYATVLENDNYSIMVSFNNKEYVISLEDVPIYNEHGKEVSSSSLQPGIQIKIIDYGGFLETAPLQLRVRQIQIVTSQKGAI